MCRFVPLTVLALVGLLVEAVPSQAQVFVRAPFVRVYVGPGVYVRAPFVTYSNMWTPPVVVEPPAQTVESLPPPLLQKQAPSEKTGKAMSLDEFAKSFQPRGGMHDVVLINPLTQAATPVRFSLPEGMPRRVIVDPQGVEFAYGLRHFVRIHFNADGVVVTSR
jgi:hypothetical protein